MELTLQGFRQFIEDKWKNNTLAEATYKKLRQYNNFLKIPLTQAYVFYYKGIREQNYDKKHQYALRALDFAKQAETDPWIIHYSYNLLGQINLMLGNLYLAADYLWKALSGYDSSKPDYNLLKNVYTNIGCLYILSHDFGEFKEALRYFLLAEKYNQKRKDPRVKESQLVNYFNIFESFYKLGKYKAAEKYLNEIIELLHDVEDDTFKVPLTVSRYLIDTKAGRNPTLNTELLAPPDHVSVQGLCDEILKIFDVLFEESNFEECKTVLSYLDQYAKISDIRINNIELIRCQIKYYHATGDKENERKAYMEFYRLNKLRKSEADLELLHGVKQYLAMKDQELEQQKLLLQQEELLRKSENDELTKLPNRYLLNEFCKTAFSQASIAKQKISVEIIDIDYLKQYNDNYGHLEGDKCIQKIAEAIQSSLSPGDLASRYGGDEFVIIRLNKTDPEVMDQALHLKEQIKSLAIPHAYSKASSIVTISQGIVNGIPSDMDSLRDFLLKADQALYEVKKKTRNAIVFCQQAA